MAKDILVAIVSDDIYARNWMSLLLVRDWRTRVIAEITCHADFEKLREPGHPSPDLFLVDLDSYRDNPTMVSSLNEQAGKQTKILCVGTQVIDSVFFRLNPRIFAGYLIKSEISSSLAWAITFAYENKVVFTPGVLDALKNNPYELPANKLIISGRSFPGLTDRQEEIARLAIIFSIGRRDLADELKCALCSPEVGQIHRGVSRDHAHSGHVREVQPLGDHLGTYEYIYPPVTEGPEDLGVGSPPPGGVHIHPRH